MLNLQVLSGNIRMYRKAKGLSQNGLAAALSISPQSVSKWECGASAPDVENLCLMAEVLGVSLDALLGRSGEQRRAMIGVDGGGTKTEFILFTEDGVILDRYAAGVCNPNAVGIKACVELLVKGINALMTGNANVCGVYIGSAGFLLGNNGTEIRNSLKQYYPHLKIKCATDMLNAVACVADTTRCISVICGTGSAVLVREGERLTRLGGFGYLLSRGGSGYDIGRDALYYAACVMDGMAERTLLYELVTAKVGDSVSDIVDKVYKSDTGYVASFASAVFEAYGKGDETAASILHSNARALADIINYGAAHYDCGNKLVLSGGIVMKDDGFVDILRQYVNPLLQITIPKYHQVLGACVLCAELCGVNTDGFIEKLAKQY